MPTQLENNITKLQEAIMAANFDISKYYLPDNEIAKNILKSKNPGMTKEDADIMIDGKISDVDASVGSVSPTASFADATSGLTASGSSQFRQGKEKINSFAKQNNLYPVPKTSHYYEEVKKIKQEVRQAVMLLIRNQKDLIQDVAKVSIKVATSIAGAAVLVSPLSFNVPAAISLVLVVIDGVSTVIKKMMDVIMHCEPIKLLVYLLPSGSFDAIVAPINVAVIILLSIFEAINALRSLVGDLSGSLSSLTSADSLSSALSALKEQLNTKLAELAALEALKNILFPNLGKVGTSKQISDKKKEVDELKSRIDKMEKGYNVPIGKNGEFPETLANEFLSKLNPKVDKINKANDELVGYVYDVLLPDGTVVKNLDEKSLEDIKHKYKVIFDTQNSD
jgi:hypothetical protein